MNVYKRNGTVVPFDKQKIVTAVNKAAKEIDGKEYPFTAEAIGNYIEGLDRDLTVEEIQDIIEDQLMNCERKDIARAYIRYRYKREAVRKNSTEFLEAISEKLNGKKIENSNANMDENSFGGRIGEATNVMMRDYALNYCMSEMAKNNHIGNRIYIHDLNAYAVGEHNCFHPNTKFITTQGLRAFSDYHDGDQITVLAPNGQWYPALVQNFGKQQVYKYTFKKNQTEKVVYATSNHRWIMEDGSFQEGLSVGDKLFESPYYWNDFDYDVLSPEGKFYWCLGFVYGDGTIATRWSKREKRYCKANTCKVKLCGNKVKFLPRFQELGYGLNCYAEEPEVSMIPYDKTIPDFNNLTIECLIAFIHGYYDADGTKALASNTGKQIYSIQAAGKEACDFIERYFASAGLYINSIIDKTGQETNFGVRKYTKNYQFFAEPSTKFHWYVKSIEKVEDTLQDVWCLYVPEVHAFVLEGGIPTGNCLSIPFDDLLANGFTTRQTDIRPANSADTAFQLIAVIFQLQSLMQFGGVSATHLDWTMVPYVRKSFRKHYIDGLKYIHNIYDEELFNHIPVNAGIEDGEYKIYKGAYNYALNLTKKEVNQGVESLFHNLNTLQSRSGNQLPFSSINYGTCALPEGRMVTQALLEGSIKGVGKFHRTAVFPCQIFQCMKGINRQPGDPNYDLFQLALKSTALRLYPNYCNVDWSVNAGYDKNEPKQYVSTMGKRKLQLI